MELVEKSSGVDVLTDEADVAQNRTSRRVLDLGLAQSIALLLMLLGSGLVVVGFAHPWLAASGLGWIGIALLLIAGSRDDRSLLPSNPLSLWALSLFFGSALRPLYLLAQPESRRLWFLSGLPEGVVVRGALLNFAFLVCALGGYLRLGRRARLVLRFRAGARYGASPLVLGGLVSVSGLALLVYMSRLGLGLADLSDRLVAKRRVDVGGQASALGALIWLNGTALLGSYVLLFLRRSQNAGRRPGRLTIGALIAVGLAVPVLNGSRDGLLQPLLILTLIGTDFGRSLRWRHVGAVLASAALVITIVGALRGAASNDLDSDVLAVSSIAEGLLDTHNWAGAEKTAVIEARVPSVMDYQSGSTYITALVAPVPRSIWPGKPAVRIGPIVGDQLFDLDRNGRTGLPPGTPGELLLNFGYLGVLVGGAIFGVVLRFVFLGFTHADETDPIRVAALVALVNLGLKLPGGDFTGVYTEILMSTILLMVLTRLLTRRPT